MNHNFSVVCCSVLNQEIAAVLAADFPGATACYLDSMLHMEPTELQIQLEKTLADQTKPSLLIYGDCSAYMLDMEKKFPCVRVPVTNCCELVLGRNLYKKFRDLSSFLFLPEWTLRWKEVFQIHLGFADSSMAQAFMHEQCKSFIFLDTGLQPVPHKDLDEISHYFNIPVSIHQTSLKHVREVMHQAVHSLTRRYPHEP